MLNMRNTGEENKGRKISKREMGGNIRNLDVNDYKKVLFCR